MVYEGATGEASRGRKPTFLYMDSRGRCAVAVDIRADAQLRDDHRPASAGSSWRSPSFATEPRPKRVRQGPGGPREAAARGAPRPRATAPGIGVRGAGHGRPRRRERAARARLWAGATRRCARPLAAATGLPVADRELGQGLRARQLMWSARATPNPPADLVFVSVSDGVGVGVTRARRAPARAAQHRGRVRARAASAWTDRPARAARRGCWEAYVSNLATLGRYFGRPLVPGRPIPPRSRPMTVDDLILRARGSDGQALAAHPEHGALPGPGARARS